MTDITQDVIDCWRINYGLDKRSPAEAAKWWSERHDGLAPSGAVAALGAALDEIDRLRADIHSCHPACKRAGCVNERLRAALREAADSIESWGAYASDYFRQKHDLAGDVARARAALGE
ncbi:MAG: hypothetical protein ACRC1H_18825 [Caldilineaceae bacterium]